MWIVLIIILYESLSPSLFTLLVDHNWRSASSLGTTKHFYSTDLVQQMLSSTFKQNFTVEHCSLLNRLSGKYTKTDVNQLHCTWVKLSTCAAVQTGRTPQWALEILMKDGGGGGKQVYMITPWQDWQEPTFAGVQR